MKKLIATLVLVVAVLVVGVVIAQSWNTLMFDVTVNVEAADPLYLVYADSEITLQQGQQGHLEVTVENRAASDVSVTFVPESPVIGIYIPAIPYLLPGSSTTTVMVLVGATFEVPAGPNTLTVVIEPL